MPADSIEGLVSILHQELSAFVTEFGSGQVAVSRTVIDGWIAASGSINFQGCGMIEVLAIGPYPVVPPLIRWNADGVYQPIAVEWHRFAESRTPLVDALRTVTHSGTHQLKYAFGFEPNRPLTEDIAIANLAGWKGVVTGAPTAADDIREALFARSSGLVTRALARMKVVILGLGSGGSYVASMLARAGVGRFTLVDPDSVDEVNLSRSTYFVEDLGHPKAYALARQLLRINPGIQVEALPCAIADLKVAGFTRVIGEADLVLALTDDPQAQLKVSHFCYHLGNPAVFAGLYRGALGGEVIIVLPDQTPCLSCSTGEVRNLPTQQQRDLDYGTGRMAGEIALGTDIQHLDSATVKIALAILLRDVASAKVGRFLDAALAQGFNFMCMGMTPDYWFFPGVFAETAGQYAYQSVWFQTSRNPACAVCGAAEAREDPTTFPLGPVQFRNTEGG